MAETELRQIHKELGVLKKHIQKIEQMLTQTLTTLPAHPRIVRIEGVRGGEPLVKGTGISVRTIVERTKLGDTPTQIADDYPTLTIAQVYDALSYYHEHTQEIEDYIRQNEEALCQALEISSSLHSTPTRT